MEPVRVLIVEDDSLVRDVFVDALTEAGFEVAEAESGDQAAAMIDADGFRLLLTDIHMPGRMDGIGLAERAARQHPRLPILFVSARPDVLGRLGPLGSRRAVVPKPCAPSEIVRIVRRLLRESG